MEYFIEWTIEVDADNPVEAAKRAWEMMRNPDSTANVFQVWKNDGACKEPVQIELSEEEGCDELAAAYERTTDEERSNGPKRY